MALWLTYPSTALDDRAHRDGELAAMGGQRTTAAAAAASHHNINAKPAPSDADPDPEDNGSAPAPAPAPTAMGTGSLPTVPSTRRRVVVPDPVALKYVCALTTRVRPATDLLTPGSLRSIPP